MKIVLALALLAFVALCHAQTTTPHPLTQCDTDVECEKFCGDDPDHAVCDVPARQCHCHDHGHAHCHSDDECRETCGNAKHCCHNDHHCHCDESCGPR